MSAKRKRPGQGKQAADASEPAEPPNPQPWNLPFARLPTADSLTPVPDSDLKSVVER
jgi:hypothetical protein